MIWIQPCHFISCNLMQPLFLLFCSLHLYFLSICLVFRFVYAAPLSLFCFCASLLLIHLAYLSGISALFTWSALAPLVFIISKLTYFCVLSCLLSFLSSYMLLFGYIFRFQSLSWFWFTTIQHISWCNQHQTTSKVFIRFWSSFKSFGFYKFCISIVYI